MAHHLKHDTIIVERIYREACEFCHIDNPLWDFVAKGLKLDPKTISLFLMRTSLYEEPKLESDAVLSLVTMAHA